MSKKKKKKHHTKVQASSDGLEKRRRNGQKILILFGLFIVFEVIYQSVLLLEKRLWPLFPVSIYVLSAIVLVLFIIYFIMNKGQPRLRYAPDDFDESIPNEQRQAMAEKYNTLKDRSKILVYFIIPLSFVLAVDYIFIFLGVGSIW